MICWQQNNGKREIHIDDGIADDHNAKTDEYIINLRKTANM